MFFRWLRLDKLVRAHQTFCVKTSAITYLVSSIVRFKTYDGKIDLIQAIFSLPIILKSLYIFSNLSVFFCKASSEHFVSGIATLTSFLTIALDLFLPNSGFNSLYRLNTASSKLK